MDNQWWMDNIVKPAYEGLRDAFAVIGLLTMCAIWLFNIMSGK